MIYEHATPYSCPVPKLLKLFLHPCNFPRNIANKNFFYRATQHVSNSRKTLFGVKPVKRNLKFRNDWLIRHFKFFCFLHSIVTMHRPDEVPFVSRDWFRVPMNQESYVSITPQVTLTADSLRSYDPQRWDNYYCRWDAAFEFIFYFSRGCYFGNERKLKYFKTYTQRNCEMECVSDYIQRQCGCARFSMPSKIRN